MNELFEPNPIKARANLAKHGVSFEEAQTVFLDELALSSHDPDHSYAEERRIIIGRAATGRLLILSFVERSGMIRIISARKLTKRETKLYENG
jgi:uncharacterized DUF497 family protein